MQVLLYETRWADDKGTIVFQASSGGRYGEKKVTFGETLSLEICSEVQCAGSKRDDVWKPCSEAVQGRRRCEGCRAREGNFVYTSFDGFNTATLSEEDLNKISGPHWVYLALFQKNLLKVGVCKEDRKALRQLEQGSHATLFIAHTPDGIKARQIETVIRNAGLADKIQSGQKKEFLFPPLSEEESQEALQRTADQFLTSLEAFGNLPSFVLPEPEYQSWADVYHSGETALSEKPYHSVKLDNGEAVSGLITMIKGPFILLDTGEELVSICTKDLLGRVIEFDEKPRGLQLKSAFQGSLF